ncbi:MAG: cell filamentation protein Fic, partial [Hyphomicrobiaceae bacterium]
NCNSITPEQGSKLHAGSHYRFFDATPHAEFLYACVQQTVEEDLPREADFLRRYDDFRAAVGAVVDMPDQTIDLLFRMLRQNNGRLSRRAREREFAGISDTEAQIVEDGYARAFEDAS